MRQLNALTTRLCAKLNEKLPLFVALCRQADEFVIRRRHFCQVDQADDARVSLANPLVGISRSAAISSPYWFAIGFQLTWSWFLGPTPKWWSPWWVKGMFTIKSIDRSIDELHLLGTNFHSYAKRCATFSSQVVQKEKKSCMSTCQCLQSLAKSFLTKNFPKYFICFQRYELSLLKKDCACVLTFTWIQLSPSLLLLQPRISIVFLTFD